MGKHNSGSRSRRLVAPVVCGVTALGVVATGALALTDDGPTTASVSSTAAAGTGTAAPTTTPSPAAPACARPALRVVTATSFAPVLAALADGLAADGDDCLRLEVTTADGRAAVAQVAATDADLWIPDDGSWTGSAESLELAEAPAAHAGTVLAESPFYLVADKSTGARLRKAGNGWLGLSRMVSRAGGAELVISDPLGSGDGMVAAGAVAEAVWQDVDMDASALWLAAAQDRTRFVPGRTPALPERAGEVGIVPEYALLPALAAAPGSLTAVPGKDHTAKLRYTWLPLQAAAADPVRSELLDRLHRELTGAGAAAAIGAADLRTPDGPAPEATVSLPAPKAKAFEVLPGHHVDHVFTTWYAEDRKTNLLVAVDVSGSMAAEVAGSGSSRIELVRRGSSSLAALLPDDSRMGLWEFGSRLDGAKDHRQLVRMSALGAKNRRALAKAVDALDVRDTGTGLYDTVLAAYTSARDTYRPGAPTQVLVFTDGRNESDDGSMTARQLSRRLQQAADPERPVQLNVVTFGAPEDAEVVGAAIEGVGGYVDVLTDADEVAAAFIHVAAGGLQH